MQELKNCFKEEMRFAQVILVRPALETGRTRMMNLCKFILTTPMM